jgi:hypothetical protein
MDVFWGEKETNLLNISNNIPFLDLHTLRLTNHYFHALIPPATHAGFLNVEMSDFDFIACVGCTRLRHMAAFSPKRTV